jgi:hypothetical protein
MTSPIYKRYNTYEKEQLFEILLHYEDYQPEAIEIAKKIVKEKKWDSEYSELLDKFRLENEQKELQLQNEYLEQRDKYKKAVEFQEEKNSFQVRTSDIPRVEGALIENEIDFYREDKHVGVQLDSYPTQTYYFKTTDLSKVDKITKDLKLRAAAYTDPQPFFRFEIKVLILVLILLAIIFAIII